MIINQIIKKPLSDDLFYLTYYSLDVGYSICIFKDGNMSTVYDKLSDDDYIYDSLDLIERVNICQSL